MKTSIIDILQSSSNGGHFKLSAIWQIQHKLGVFNKSLTLGGIYNPANLIKNYVFGKNKNSAGFQHIYINWLKKFDQMMMVKKKFIKNFIKSTNFREIL